MVEMILKELMHYEATLSLLDSRGSVLSMFL